MKDNINIQTNNLMRVFFCFFVVVVVYRPFELRGYCHGGLFCVFFLSRSFRLRVFIVVPQYYEGTLWCTQCICIVRNVTYINHSYSFFIKLILWKRSLTNMMFWINILIPYFVIWRSHDYLNISVISAMHVYLT